MTQSLWGRSALERITVATKMDDLIAVALGASEELSGDVMPECCASLDWQNDEERALFKSLCAVHVSRALVAACYRRKAPIEFMARSRLELRRHELALHTSTQRLVEAHEARRERELDAASREAETRVRTKLAKDFSIQAREALCRAARRAVVVGSASLGAACLCAHAIASPPHHFPRAQARMEANVEKLMYVENNWHLIEPGAAPRHMDADTARKQVLDGMIQAESKGLLGAVKKRYKKLEREREALFEFVQSRAARVVWTVYGKLVQ